VIVVDASVITAALVDDGDVGHGARTALRDDVHWAAPSHLLVEVVSAVRGLVAGGKVTPRRGSEAIRTLGEFVIDTVDIAPLLARIWQLRHNLSAYDAGYVAVAEALACPLVTGDRRLRDATGLRCQVHLISP
jgi:predicted nucleic acid-binding protein